MADIHALIRETFGLRNRRVRRDNLPINVKHGGDRTKLGELFAKAGFHVGAEIGVKKGDFSLALLKANPGLRLFCVDLWAPHDEGDKKYAPRYVRYFEQAKKALEPYDATLVQKSSMEAVKAFADDSLDFVYIDAAHDYDHCCPDIIYWSQKVHSGGIVACHDYFHHIQGGVVRAVDAYTQSHRIDPIYVTYELMPTVFWVKP